jgi:hypothetical protein
MIGYLRQILILYNSYYKESRTHLSVHKDTPTNPKVLMLRGDLPSGLGLCLSASRIGTKLSGVERAATIIALTVLVEARRSPFPA